MWQWRYIKVMSSSITRKSTVYSTTCSYGTEINVVALYYIPFVFNIHSWFVNEWYMHSATLFRRHGSDDPNTATTWQTQHTMMMYLFRHIEYERRMDVNNYIISALCIWSVSSYAQLFTTVDTTIAKCAFMCYMRAINNITKQTNRSDDC